ncbi:hypothetical protein J7T55_013178 [Diaporthe amygdali]|uniref:uncharacterized protein n=1 Tax=Phomopsis amygdali TaxID=1214568 RepID=UPI0022FEAC97|nr:uncharacterized protein J7T55_013178 [Diaporthe amygdali]KAJ0118922.1 hypothetical protein J7T55_013178 [Diaporthe amygdali]
MEKESRNISPSNGHEDICFQRHMVADTIAAITSAAIIAPIITATDRSVVESVSTSSPLLKTLAKHLLCPFINPRRFFATKPVFVVWTLYAATYFTANVTETVSEKYFAIEKALTGTIVSSAVFIVNTPLGVWKDVRFSQFFSTLQEPAAQTTTTKTSRVAASAQTGAGSPKAASPQIGGARKVPLSATGAFLLRDIITVFGSFALAPQVSAIIPDALARTEKAKASAAQLIVPALTQVVATPVHLLALDIYNRPGRLGFAGRAAKTREKLASTTVMRAFRLVPAFGFGVIFNNHLRSSLKAGGAWDEQAP